MNKSTIIYEGVSIVHRRIDTVMTTNNINLDKLNTYLSTLDDRGKEYATKIVDNTIYISTANLVEMIRRSLKKFIELHSKYNLFIPNDKIGSEHYLILQVQDMLTPVKIIFGIESVDNDYPILIIDDAIYSSVNVCVVILIILEI